MSFDLLIIFYNPFHNDLVLVKFHIGLNLATIFHLEGDRAIPADKICLELEGYELIDSFVCYHKK